MNGLQPFQSHNFFRLNTLSANTAPLLPAQFTNFARNTCIRLDELSRSVQLHCQSVLVDQDSGLGFEEAINILERTIGRLWIKEVSNWNKGEADDGPYNPELVSELLNAR